VNSCYLYSQSRMSTKWPSTAAAAAMAGETKCVRPPLPWRPSNGLTFGGRPGSGWRYHIVSWSRSCLFVCVLVALRRGASGLHPGRGLRHQRSCDVWNEDVSVGRRGLSLRCYRCSWFSRPACLVLLVLLRGVENDAGVRSLRSRPRSRYLLAALRGWRARFHPLLAGGRLCAGGRRPFIPCRPRGALLLIHFEGRRSRISLCVVAIAERKSLCTAR